MEGGVGLGEKGDGGSKGTEAGMLGEWEGGGGKSTMKRWG